ncbi:MAG: ShlB/FhaC/HecB family hemolysin secretion/activation protein [Verrucomicrobia bacterium]|nr:ShlB/FhaC/HecB family hemolysin secretion/activation protein [Verrucomicrobiota bacterium]
MLKKKLYLLVIFSLIASTLAAYPPPVPSAGVIERELEKEYEAKPLEQDKEVPAIQIDIPKERLEIPEGKKVFVRKIEIRGNESISAKEICRWVGGCVGKELSLKDIYELCNVIDQHYAEQGYFLARAYPPPQDIVDDTLTIEILEGKLGNVEVVGNKHYKTDFIRGYFKGLQNKPLKYEHFMKALLLLNENTDLTAGAVFEKGKEFGCADVILRVDDSRPVHLYLNGNNYGRNLTTNARAGGRLDWGNLITQGDTLSIAEVVGFPVDALYFTDVSYTAPLNKKGTSLEAAYLFSKFKIEELTSLHLKGRSDIATLKVNQAMMRTRSWSIDLFSYFDYKQIQNFVLSHRTSFDKLRVLTVGALFDHFCPSQGRDYLTLRFGAGIPNFLGGLKPVDSESSRRGGGGRFFLFNADYDRIQHLPKDCFFYFHGSGQLSPSKLTLPEQIYIGGMDTVRGFPLAVALGDSGYYVNFEFRIPPPLLANKKVFNFNKKWKDILQFDAFLDHGGTFLQSERNTFLWGTGVGVRVNFPYTLTFSLDVGFPLNHRSLTRGCFTYIKLTGQPF